jgi:hypothetical protein
MIAELRPVPVESALAQNRQYPGVAIARLHYLNIADCD